MPKKTMKTTDKTGNKNAERSVFLMRDSVVEFPDLWMEVFIAGDETEEQAFAQMFCRSACTKARSPDEADLVVFTGGPDVNPALYGEKPHPETSWDDIRDQHDIRLWEHCVKNGIPMLGVCRGAQFGYVMKGGKLYQDVDKHYGDHSIWDVKKNFQITTVSSVHHQMVRPNTVEGVEVLADAYVASTRWWNDKEKTVGNVADIEAFYFRDVCFLGVQGHPEYKGYSRFTKWVLEQLQYYVVENPDVELIDNVRRIKPELRVKSEVSKVLKELA